MQIRPYQPTASASLLNIFQMNVPAAFGANEVAEYAEFLNTHTDPYFVAEHNGQVVGACGAYMTQDQQTARISWILTNPGTHELSVGSALMGHCLDLIRQWPTVRHIECRTSQVAYRFFEKFGFALHYTKPDKWAPGLDLYFMSMPNS